MIFDEKPRKKVFGQISRDVPVGFGQHAAARDDARASRSGRG